MSGGFFSTRGRMAEWARRGLVICLASLACLRPAFAETEAELDKRLSLAGAPSKSHEMVVCTIGAAIEYRLPADVLLAVAQQEGGQPGSKVRNRDGSYDLGSMQFNTRYLRELSAYGITPEDVSRPGCYPYRLAAWRIARHVAMDRGSFWRKVANYHSRTPKFNRKYQQQIYARAKRWGVWLHRNMDQIKSAFAMRGGPQAHASR